MYYGLVGECGPVDRSASSPVEVRDVSGLHDEVLHESVELGSLVAEFGLKEAEHYRTLNNHEKQCPKRCFLGTRDKTE